MKEDLLKIIKHYGVSNQLKKLSEEVFEFQESVIQAQSYEPNENGNIKNVCDNVNSYVEHIEEELGDILVLLIQFVAYYGIKLEDGNVLKIMNEKIARQLKRTEEENE